MSINGEKLKKIREGLNITQSKLSDIIDCYPHQVSMWESGKIPLSDKRYSYFEEVLDRYENNLINKR